MAVPARLGIVTLGVSDLDRSIEFYNALGWEQCDSSIEGEIAWFQTADTYVGLFPYGELAADANFEQPARGSFGGITLAINVETPTMVEEALDEAVAAGATLLKPATEFAFGVSGYFADPDGYPWEVAYNPSFPIDEDGRITIP
jgi:catechol 2,3-dioxygenase-like lactoylglutathione lyase family enzyme